MLQILINSMLVYGNGYELLKGEVDYKLISSVKGNHPEEIAGTSTRAIHIQLHKDMFLSQRFLEVSLSAQIVLSGLEIDTKRSMALQTFSIQYARRDIQYPGQMETVMVR